MRQQKGPHVFNELKAGAAELVIPNNQTCSYNVILNPG